MINGAKLISISGYNDEIYIDCLQRMLSKDRQVVVAPNKGSIVRDALETYSGREIGLSKDSIPGEETYFAMFLALQRLAFIDQVIPALREGKHVITNLDFFPAGLFDQSLISNGAWCAEYAKRLRHARDHYSTDLAFQLLYDPQKDENGLETVHLVKAHSLATRILSVAGSKDDITRLIDHEVRQLYAHR